MLDGVILHVILRSLQDPFILPEPQTRPDPTLAAPGLAALIQAAASGDVAALQLLGQMGTHMLNAGGDMAYLSAILHHLDNERDPDLLCPGDESAQQATGALAPGRARAIAGALN